MHMATLVRLYRVFEFIDPSVEFDTSLLSDTNCLVRQNRFLISGSASFMAMEMIT
jgi:hypothetical protein